MFKQKEKKRENSLTVAVFSDFSVLSEVLGSMEGGQAIKVQADSFFSPEALQRQVLQPVAPVAWVHGQWI